MSNSPTPKPLVVHDVPPQPEVTEKKQNFVRRSVNFLKAHKKSTIAGAGLLTLVGVSAWAGRRSADYSLDIELEKTSDDADSENTEPDTTVA